LVTNLATALREHADLLETHLARYATSDLTPFVALNTAFLGEGAFVSLPRNAVVENTIHLLFVSTESATPTASHPRTLILAGENSQATLIETYVGTEGATYLTNAVTEIVLEANAHLDHVKVQQESLSAYHVAYQKTQMGRSSVFRSHSIVLGGAIARNDANAFLGGEGGECTLNGLTLGQGKQLLDNHTAIDHAVPHCNSHELYKSILNDQARGVFNGKIFVQKDAQKTDAKQTNQTLLLSKAAQINTKPQLEIFADDVKCTHGATIGQLQEEPLFYLRSRGIGLEEARSLLTYAFASEVLDGIRVEAVREQAHKAMFDSLPFSIRPEEA
jgi:Fe-S cluster assembly protein SufD